MHATMWEAILAGILTMSLCLSIHALFMFAVLRSQVHFRHRFPKVTGISLVVPSILLATVLIVISSVLQIAIWAGISGRPVTSTRSAMRPILQARHTRRSDRAISRSARPIGSSSRWPP